MIAIRTAVRTGVGILATLLAFGALSAASSASADSASPVIYSRAVYAAFDQEASGAYSVDVGARADVTHHVTSAQTRGEVSGAEKLYYFAYGVNDRIQLRISAGDTHAALHAVIPVLYCFDTNGDQVVNPRCPVGQLITVDASFSAAGAIEVFRQEGTVAWGRKAAAAAEQDDSELGGAQYAEIVENLTRTQQ